MTRQAQNQRQFTAFGLWLKAQPDLDSEDYGLSIDDIDLTVAPPVTKTVYGIQSYKDPHIERVMFVETKTHLGMIRFHQKSLHYHMNYLAIDNSIRQPVVYTLKEQWKRLVFYGYHRLVFERETPEDGRMWWNGQQISRFELARILRFEIDARTVGEWLENPWLKEHQHQQARRKAVR